MYFVYQIHEEWDNDVLAAVDTLSDASITLEELVRLCLPPSLGPLRWQRFEVVGLCVACTVRLPECAGSYEIIAALAPALLLVSVLVAGVTCGGSGSCRTTRESITWMSSSLPPDVKMWGPAKETCAVPA